MNNDSFRTISKLLTVFLLLCCVPFLQAQVSVSQTPDGITVRSSLPSRAESLLLQSAAPEGFLPYGTAGDPSIYGRLLHIAIPPGSQVSLRVDADRFVRRAGVLRAFESEAPNSVRNGVYPASPVTISDPKVFRDVTYVDVWVFPVQVDAGKGLKVHRSLSFTLSFAGGTTASRRQLSGPFGPTYDTFFANEWRDKVSVPAKTPALSAPWLPPAHTGQVYKLSIRKNGVYKLDQSFISANTGWSVGTLDPRQIRVFSHGNEIPIYVSGELDGSFDSGDAVYLYGVALTGENQPGVWQKGDYTDDNVYWLILGTQNGLRMSTRDAAPTNTFTVPTTFVSTEHFEENHFIWSFTNTDQSFYPFQNQADTDLWLWKPAFWFGGDSSNAVQHYNVTVPSVSSNGAFQATLRFTGRGRTVTANNPDHHIVLKLNGNTIGNFFSDDYTPFDQSYQFNQSMLGGPGSVGIDFSHEVTDPSLLGVSTDLVQSNFFELTYSRNFQATSDALSYHEGAGAFQFEIPGFSSGEVFALDVTTPDAPVRLINAQITQPTTFQIAFQDSIGGGGIDYATAVPQAPSAADLAEDIPSDLGNINANVNWILIAPQAWTSGQALQDLKTLRQNQGLIVEIVSVEDIYDEFNYGIFSPDAIKSFLQTVYNAPSTPQLQYVVLLGDADYDTHDYGGDGNFNFVPTYMVADPGVASAFFPYALHSFDNYFGCLVGNDDVPEFFIGRIPVRSLTEATNTIDKILFYETGISDHSWLGKNLFIADCQDSSEFEPEQDQNASYVHPIPPGQVTKMYFAQAPWSCSTVDSDSNTFSDAVDAINSGQAAVSYVGHGGFTQLGALSILQNSDAANFTNSSMPTVLLNSDCFTGAFYHATVPSSLLEAFLDGQSGIVSGFAPGTFMFGFQQWYINGTFFGDTFGIDKARNLGAVYQHIYANLDAGDTRLAQGMVAFGDPATNLAVPAPAAPQNLQASVVTCGSIDLAWDPPASFSGTYNVYRATSVDGPFTQVNALPVAATNYSDAPPADATYFYYVAAVDTEGFEGAASNVVSQFAAPGGLTLSPSTLNDGNQNVLYSQGLSANGGTGPYTFTVVSGSLPSGITLSSAGLLSGTTAQTGTFNFTVKAEDASLCGTQAYSLTIIAAPTCLFCDDFNDGNLSNSWTYTKGTWTEPGGFLQGVFAKKATAVATPAFVGCVNCAVEADMKIAASAGKIYLMGWYQDKKNHTELRMDPVNDYWMLKQVGAGTSKKIKFHTPVNAGTNYHAKITFDGTNFQVYIDNVLIITMSKIGATNPSGTVGFLVKSATGLFDSITVN